MSREQGDTKLDLGSTKNYFGEHQEHNSGSREKRVKFQREPGAGDPPPPYGVSLVCPFEHGNLCALSPLTSLTTFRDTTEEKS